MRRLINNRMYPSVNGGPRRMWDPDDICAFKDGKVYAKSEGWTKIKVNDVLKANKKVYCDLDVFNKDISSCPSWTVSLKKYWAIAKVNLTDGDTDYTYYMALQRGRYPYLLKVDGDNNVAETTDCDFIIPNINAP